MDYKVIRSSRKTLSIQITEEAEIMVRAPYRMSDSEIRKYLKQHEGWVEQHLIKMKERRRQAASIPRITPDRLNELADEAMSVIPDRVRYYAGKMGVTYGRITIRNQKTRWGSCSSKGNLNFNCLLMLAPPEVLDYVVVHELCHRKEMNHSPKFWQEVEKVIPDYRRWRQWLKDNGGQLLLSML